MADAEEKPQADADAGLTEDQRVGHYIDMWKQAVEVQQHFNDIEWRIRGLALTVATFALGAAGVAAKDQSKVGPVSLGAIVIVVGLILWYSFYFVDRVWYHPLLIAAVEGGTHMEDEIRKSLPAAGLTRGITAGSPYRTPPLVRILTRKPELHSVDKLIWFYQMGAAALVIVAIALQGLALVTNATSDSKPTDVNVHFDQKQSPPGQHR